MVNSRTELIDPSGSENGWSKASEYCSRVGPICVALPSIIRTLYVDERNNKGQLSAITKYHVGRICCGPNFKAMLYHFTRLVEPEYLSDKASITVGELLDLYTPSDLAALLTTFSIRRMIKKRIKEELFEGIRPQLAREAHIGALTGLAVPNLGLGRGILWGALPHICRALMSSQEPATYTAWRRSLANPSMKERTTKEREIWGCSSAQVASLLLVKLGFPAQSAQSLASASDYCGGVATIQDGETRLARMALIWFECLLTGQSGPNESVPANFFPSQGVRAPIDETIKEFTSSDQSWIEKASGDISPERTPQLFTKSSDANKDLQVPDQLKEVFTLEALTKMDEWQFDDLVSHIDKEIADGNISADGTVVAAEELDSAIS